MPIGHEACYRMILRSSCLRIACDIYNRRFSCLLHVLLHWHMLHWGGWYHNRIGRCPLRLHRRVGLLWHLLDHSMVRSRHCSFRIPLLWLLVLVLELLWRILMLILLHLYCLLLLLLLKLLLLRVLLLHRVLLVRRLQVLLDRLLMLLLRVLLLQRVLGLLRLHRLLDRLQLVLRLLRLLVLVLLIRLWLLLLRLLQLLLLRLLLVLRLWVDQHLLMLCCWDLWGLRSHLHTLIRSQPF